ncbi:MAG: phosphoglycerate dehydrogenase [Neomegalonema sp.]|nr:phosphoglycerate dehydrogenase [Neomegalonema sp.]
MTWKLSLPKEQIPILLLEGIAQTAVDALTAAGYTNITHMKTALDAEDLKEALKGVRMVGIRSRTKITEDIIQACPRLIAVGCFSVGTNQVDLNATRCAGVPVFNAPFSNTRSVAELTIAEIVMLYRGIFTKSVAAHEGRWIKSAVGSREIRGKTLGIVGYGNIGTQLATLAEAMGMNVVFYDQVAKLQPGTVRSTSSLQELLQMSDVVSLHLPETELTRNIMGEEQIRAMKQGSYLINNARGTLIDLEALAEALKDGHLAGAAVDVFPVEPSSNNEPLQTPLRGVDNVILTPHIGGSTEEAQQQIGAEVAKKLIDYSDIGSTMGAVNFPQVQLPVTENVTRFLQVQHNVPGGLQTLNEVFAKRELNITGQHFQTDGQVGYVVLDAQGSVPDAEEIVEEIRALPATVRARRLNSVG